MGLIRAYIKSWLYYTKNKAMLYFWASCICKWAFWCAILAIEPSIDCAIGCILVQGILPTLVFLLFRVELAFTLWPTSSPWISSYLSYVLTHIWSLNCVWLDVHVEECKVFISIIALLSFPSLGAFSLSLVFIVHCCYINWYDQSYFHLIKLLGSSTADTITW